MRTRAADLLPLLLAVIVPLAGVLLALSQLGGGDRPAAARIGAATVVGVAVWALALT